MTYKDFINTNDPWHAQKRCAIKRMHQYKAAQLRIRNALKKGIKPNPDDIKYIYQF